MKTLELMRTRYKMFGNDIVGSGQIEQGEMIWDGKLFKVKTDYLTIFCCCFWTSQVLCITC